MNWGDKKGHVGMEGRDPLLRRDKGKRKQLGKCRTISGQEKDLGLRLRGIQSLTAGLSSDWSPLPVYAPGEDRRQPWVWWQVRGSVRS